MHLQRLLALSEINFPQPPQFPYLFRTIPFFGILMPTSDYPTPKNKIQFHFILILQLKAASFSSFAAAAFSFLFVCRS